MTMTQDERPPWLESNDPTERIAQKISDAVTRAADHLLDPSRVPEWTDAERAEYRRRYLTGEAIQHPTHEAGDPCATCDALRSLQREAEAEDDAAGCRSTSTPRERGGSITNTSKTRTAPPADFLRADSREQFSPSSFQDAWAELGRAIEQLAAAIVEALPGRRR